MRSSNNTLRQSIFDEWAFACGERVSSSKQATCSFARRHTSIDEPAVAPALATDR
jgi:hypothetical protein